jgi:hypothetical protein
VMLYAFAFCGAVIGAERGVVGAAARRGATPVTPEAVEVLDAAEPDEPDEPDSVPTESSADQPPQPPRPEPPLERARSLLRSGRAWLRDRRGH